MGADVDLESSNGYVLRMGCMKKKGNIYEIRIELSNLQRLKFFSTGSVRSSKVSHRD